jgi:hypothetical protein
MKAILLCLFLNEPHLSSLTQHTFSLIKVVTTVPQIGYDSTTKLIMAVP